MRLLTIALVVAGCASLSCGGDNGGGGDTRADTTEDVRADGTDTDPTADGTRDAAVAPPDVEGPPAPYTIGLDQSSTVGWVGQPMTARAYVATGDPGGVITWFWVVEGGSASGPEGEAEQTLTFDATGDHRVRVVASDGAGGVTETATMVRIYPAGGRHVLGDLNDDTLLTQVDVDMLREELLGRAELTSVARERADVDLDFRIDDDDLAMLEEAVVRGDGAPRRLSPTSGSRGRLVRIIHPGLLNPGAQARVRFGDAEPLLPIRGRPGYATTLVPLIFTEASEVELALEVGGDVVETWRFSILASPETSAEPGDLVVKSMTLLAEVAPRLTERTEALLAAVEDADEADKAPLRAVAATAAEILATEPTRFIEAFSELDPEARALFEELALANGLADAYADLEAAAQTFESGLSVGASDKMIDAICFARDYVEAMQTVARINTVAASILDGLKLLQLDKIPYVGPVIQTLSAASKLVKVATDIVDYLEGFIPSFDDTIKITATGPDEGRANVLKPGEEATVTATLPLHLGVGLCTGVGGAGATFLLNKLRDFALASLTRDIPTLSGLFDKPEAELGPLEEIFVDRSRALVDTIADLLGVNRLLESLINKLCRALFEDTLSAELTLDASVVVNASCGAVASAGGGSGTWSCDSECADKGVRLAAFGPDCASSSVGTTTLACRDCDAESCPDGCCTPALECRPGMTDDACGQGGQACAQCEGYDECKDAVCQCVSDCTSAQWSAGKRCEETLIRECTQAEPGCFKEEPPFDCATGEASCEDGACVGGCGAWNCPPPDEPPGGQGFPCCGRGEAGALECRRCRIVPHGGGAGDPHMVSFDGLFYDFQAAGEFVLVEPVRGGIGPRVMARLVPYRDATCPDVAIISAVAAKVGKGRVTFVTTSDGAGRARVDGLELGLVFGEQWALDGATLERTNRGWTVVWDDGSRLDVTPRETWLDVRMSLAPRWARMVRGLLGNYDNDRNNDLATRDGATVLAHPIPWDRLYDTVGESYRVAAAETLFDYDVGSGWGSFDDPSFPTGAAGLEALDDDARALGEATCRTVRDLDPALFDSCVLDVACSGSRGAADGLSGMGNGELTPAALSFALSLTGWTVEGEADTGSWVVSEGGDSVLQGVNGGATFFVSPDEYLDTTITGTLRVDAGGDDDLIGFAFGYQGPLAGDGDASDFDLFLVSWKQRDQATSAGFAPAGFTLARVSGPLTNEDELDAFWTHDAADWAAYTTLAQVVDPDLGWELHRDHRFRLDYTSERLRVLIDGGIIFELSAEEAGLERFPSGRFALYNNSQQGATYGALFGTATEP